MNLAELGTMEILENITDHEEPSLESLEQVVYEDTSIVENLELEERNGDDMAAARPRDIIKPKMMMLWAHFLRKWRVIHYLNLTKKWNWRDG
jgi:hypothetical protein